MTHSLNVALLGVSGRMGRALLHALPEFSDIKLTGALVSANSPWVGKDVGLLLGGVPQGVVITAEHQHAVQTADVVIDFTLPHATVHHVTTCAALHKPMVIGTTGHTDVQQQAIQHAATHVPLLLSPNMSVGVNVLLKLAALAAQALNADYDIEIHEAHHRNKKDAPSGTALRLGTVVAAARGVTVEQQGDFIRHGADQARQRGHIGFAVTRGGDIVGDHTVTLAGPGERLELIHRAHDRSGFARGAFIAARWLRDRTAGIYSMQDVLGL